MMKNPYLDFPNIGKILERMENPQSFCLKIGAVLSGDKNNHDIPHIKVQDDSTLTEIKNIITGTLKKLVMFIEPNKTCDIANDVRMIVLTDKNMIHDPMFQKLDKMGFHFMIVERI